MTAAALTFGQIKAQVATVRKHNAHERVIGIRARGRWTGERCKPDGNESYIIEQCDSPLAMRIALRDNADSDVTKVLITSLEEKELGEDILLRLAKRRLFTIDSWQLLRAQFKARTIDPRVSQQAWIADYLLEVSPAEGFPPAPGGFLDAETVWAVLLERQLGLSSDRPDLLALLKWSIEADHIERLQTAPAPFCQALGDWLVQQLGPVAKLIVDCILSQPRPDALAVGLAAGVVFNQDIRGRLDKAAGKMEERYLGGQTPDTGQVERWSAAATEVVSLQLTDDPRKRGTLLKRADEILVELQAGEYAHVSHTLPLGFDQRFARFGLLLSEAIPHAASHALVSLTEAWQAIGQHEQSRVPDDVVASNGAKWRYVWCAGWVIARVVRYHSRHLAKQPNTMRPRADLLTGHVCSSGHQNRSVRCQKRMGICSIPSLLSANNTPDASLNSFKMQQPQLQAVINSFRLKTF